MTTPSSSQGSAWLKAELIGRSEVAVFKKERDLFPSGKPLFEELVEKPATAGEDEGDARTLYVDHDEQGLRHDRLSL